MKATELMLKVFWALQCAFVVTYGCTGSRHALVTQGQSDTARRTILTDNQQALNSDICAFAGPLGLFQHRDCTCYTTDNQIADPPPMEILPLVVSGKSSNRIDLVFFSDGYTVSERDQFFADAQRLADDITGNQTFYTVQPLMNFWAAFSPSNESGVGVGGVAKDTVYGLYRDGTELRGLYYKKPGVARAACASLGDVCDYPILLGNDPYYGGLGGQFTTVTASHLNGPLVLRHELGHSIIDVGEEYDGGFAYFGVNNFHNLSEPVSWKHWLTDLSFNDSPRGRGSQAGHHHTPSTSPRVERLVMPLQKYVWTLLNTTTPWTVEFNSSGQYSRHLLMFSLSSIPHKSSLLIEMDGVEVDWTPEPTVGLDRWHYFIQRPEALEEGIHEIKFTLKDASLEPRAQLCSIEVLEFGDESEFISKPGHYSLYPTFSMDNVTSYRPTNEDCLMRRVTTPNFCKVCTEGLWLSLLKGTRLIDNLTQRCVDDQASTNRWWFTSKKRVTKVFELDLLPLAQFRQNPGGMQALGLQESYTVTWKRNGEILNQFTNQTRVEIDDLDAVGLYAVDVQFSTDEVRLASDLLRDSREFSVTTPCSSRD